MRGYFEFASRTPVLVALFATKILLSAVFPNLPIGGDMLDVKKLGYTFDEAETALKGYGEQGRRVYAWSSATLDTVFPVVYASFLAGFVYRFRPGECLWWLAYLPVAAGVLDLCENVQIILMLCQYPNISAGQVASASLFTLSKWSTIFVCSALAVTFVAISCFLPRLCQLRSERLVKKRD